MTEPYEPLQRRDPFARVDPEYAHKPSIEGRDTLAWAMAELVPKRKPPKQTKWWQRWLKWWFKRPKLLVVFLVADFILGSLGWHFVFSSSPGAAKGAVNTTLSDVSHRNWSGVYDSLCRDDRAQVDESNLAVAGDAALTHFGLGLARWTETSVNTVHQSLGPVNLPAVQVSGELYPVTGSPSPFTVTVVHEVPGGWHVCMSAGGFSMLGYTEPLGSGFTP
ncbi:MAG TPA: hypothetical protein VHB69_07220 [Mycobacteriales bacterium]|nr:hypothetical protein [Mycobacteriales bacterium]